MPFIGIFAKENDGNYIKNNVLKNIDINGFEIINIKKNNIENLKNIKFDIIVVDIDIKEFFYSSNYLVNIILKSNYLIVNSDIKNNANLLKTFKYKTITYGFNVKSNVTISSIKEENILICVQENIRINDEIIIEMQDFNVIIKKKNTKKLCNILIIFTILGIFGKKIKKI